MKLLLFIFCLFIFCGCNSKTEEQIFASKYNDEIVNIQKQADEALISILSDMETIESAKFLVTYEINRDLTYEMLEKAKGLDKFNDDDKLKPALIKLLNIYCDLYENELSGLIDIFLKKTEDINQEDIEFIYHLYENIKLNYEDAKQEFLSEQKIFAKNKGLELYE